jgi:hypothetical protein
VNAGGGRSWPSGCGPSRPSTRAARP